MESPPEHSVAFFGSDLISFRKGLTKDEELSIVLVDIFFTAHSRPAVVMYKII